MRAPETVTQLQNLLWLVNYCHAWIPAYHDKSLRCLIQHGMGPRDLLNWTYIFLILAEMRMTPSSATKYLQWGKYTI